MVTLQKEMLNTKRPETYEEHALQQLRAAGFRITMPRVQVIRALAESKKALSAYAIHGVITASQGRIDVVSVYRILSTLQEVGLIHHVGVADGYIPCLEQNCDGKHTMIAIDETTKNFSEIQLPQEVIDSIYSLAAERGVEITSLKLEITSK
jgi:Fur family transcriptional regulator, zinc uptake regulator